MPFTKDGITPDIIINPHAIPSRMTIAQLLECLLGKTCCETGNFGDGSAFNETPIDLIKNTLLKLGHNNNGDEILYNGITGDQIKTSIFMGPTYYQRLKHMSCDKIHSRSSGPIVTLTRQPAEGKSISWWSSLWRNGKRLYDSTWIIIFLKRKNVRCFR